ncbi:MAG: hypothetical protein ACJA2S_005064 [Cyclobacteriaceae bacterium]|jgi:hypothetical protein
MKRHKESLMRLLYNSWETSGLGKKSFAIQEKISPSTFYYWVAKFEGRAKELPVMKGFHPIVLEDVVSLPVTATIRYPSGVSIEWHGGADSIPILKTLIS